MKNLWTTIKVTNMKQSLYFYNEILGLKITNTVSVDNEMEITFLGEGETKLELVSEVGISNIEYNGNVSTGFQVESLDSYIDKLTVYNIPILIGPLAPNEHTSFIIIEDPDGYRIQLVELS